MVFSGISGSLAPSAPAPFPKKVSLPPQNQEGKPFSGLDANGKPLSFKDLYTQLNTVGEDGFYPTKQIQVNYNGKATQATSHLGVLSADDSRTGKTVSKGFWINVDNGKQLQYVNKDGTVILVDSKK